MNTTTTYSEAQIKEIAKRIRASRLRLNISQRQLADRISAEKNVIQRLENGKLKSINKERLFNLAFALDCNPNYLFLKTNDPRPQHSSEPLYYTAPLYQHTAEQFLYSHMPFKRDIDYISKYMHTDLQDQFLSLIHTMVIFHKCSVHFPNTTPEKARTMNFNKLQQTIEDNFFDSWEEKSKK